MRQRFERLAGGRARANALVERERFGLQPLRTVRLPRALRARAAGEIRLLSAPSGVVEVDYQENDTLSGADVAIRAAGYPVAFPDSAAIRLPRSALLPCETPCGDCTVVLVEGGVITGNVIRSFPADQLPPNFRRP